MHWSICAWTLSSLPLPSGLPCPVSSSAALSRSGSCSTKPLCTALTRALLAPRSGRCDLVRRLSSLRPVRELPGGQADRPPPAAAVARPARLPPLRTLSSLGPSSLLAALPLRLQRSKLAGMAYVKPADRAKGGASVEDGEGAPIHRIRITLSSTATKNLEKGAAARGWGISACSNRN